MEVFLQGLTCDMEFVPSGLFYLDSDQAILSSNLTYWNETTTPYSGNAWGGMEPWWTVGFTTNGTVYTSSKTSICLNDTTYEDLNPLNYQAINGHSRAAYWDENFSSLPYQYNYTFLLSNLNTIAGWHYAEMWVPQNVSALSLYTSADNGTTWTAGLKYNWTTATGSGTFATSNGTSVNATIYDHGEPYGIVANVTTTLHADNSPTYEYSSQQGVYDRLAIGVSLQGDTGQNPLNSSSAAFIKVQVFFNDSARYWFDALASPEFTAEPGQGYGLLNQTDGRLSFITYGNATAPAWAIGMNQTMSHLRITNYPNGSLENVLFAWGQAGVIDQSTFEFNTNVLAFLSVNTTAYSLGDTLVPDIFEYGADNLRFQFHESLVYTDFWPMVTEVANNQRRYYLAWNQWLTPTTWSSPGNYTVALPHPTTTNGWAPISAVYWLYVRSGSPLTSIIDSTYLGLTYVYFHLFANLALPPLGTGTLPPSPTSTQPPTGFTPAGPSATLTPSTLDSLIAVIIIGIILFFIVVLVMKRRRK